MLCAHERAHLGVCIGAGADLDLLDARAQRIDQRVTRLIAHRDGYRDCHAALTGRAESGTHQSV